MTTDLMDRILRLKKILSIDNEEQTSSDVSKQFNETPIFSKNKRCLGETLLLIKRLSEKYGGSQDNDDSEMNKNSDVLKTCSEIMNELFIIEPMEEDGEINQHIQQTYQFAFSSVLDELEKMAINPQGNPNPSEFTDEVAILRETLKNEIENRKLEDWTHQLMLLDRTTEKAMLAQKERELESVNEEIRKLWKEYEPLDKSYMALQKDILNNAASIPEETQEEQDEEMLAMDADTNRELGSDNEDKGTRKPRSLFSFVKRIFKNLL